jgi:hypothetical protein
MACENLCVPEEYLLEVVNVIRAGVEVIDNISEETEVQLERWCDKMERYMSNKRRKAKM